MKRNSYASPEDFLSQNSELKTGLPYTEDTSVLASPLKVGSRTISNRLCCQPMEGCGGLDDFTPDELTRRHYRLFAQGGSGLIWYEATAVLPEAKANAHQLHINDSNTDGFKKAVEELKEAAVRSTGREPVVILQLTHSGRYSKPQGYPAPMTAYSNPITEQNKAIDPGCIVTDEYLDRTKDALVHAAVLAEKAGFDGADIKCCHGYLDCELLSAFTRPGRYGGSLENRTRLLRESVKGAIESTGDFIITSRFNAYDGNPYPYGFGVSSDGSLDFDPTEPAWVLEQLLSYGVELVNITMGNPYFHPHFNRPFMSGDYVPEEHPLESTARMLLGTGELKKRVPAMKLMCSALSFLGTAAPGVAAAMINNGSFDLAGFGRQIFAYPDYAADILSTGSMKAEKRCMCCSKCTEIMRTGNASGCPVRDRQVYLPIYKKYCKGE